MSKHAAVRYVRIPPDKWGKFQHYKNRNPPWIKLHLNLAENQAFHALTDTAKVHLIGLWMLAAKLENQIPDTPLWLNRTNMSKRPVRIAPLIAAGFLELVEQDETGAITLASTDASVGASNGASKSAKALVRGRARDTSPSAVSLGETEQHRDFVAPTLREIA